MSDIFREVDEALQKEKVTQIWKEYGPVLLVGIVALVVFTGAFTAFKSWNAHVNKIETAKLVLAAEEKDIASAMEKAAEDTRDGQKAIGLMNAATKAASDKNFSKAAALYIAVAEDKGVSKDLRDLSKILYVRALQSSKEKDATNYNVMIEVLEPVAKADRSPFNTLAKVEVATLYGSGLNNPSKALEFLKDFDQSSKISDSLKEKALALKRIYTYELSKEQKTKK